MQQAARAYRRGTTPRTGRNRNEMSSFNVGHQTMPVAVGVLPPLHQFGRGNDGSANSHSINLDPD